MIAPALPGSRLPVSAAHWAAFLAKELRNVLWRSGEPNDELSPVGQRKLSHPIFEGSALQGEQVQSRRFR